MAIIVKNEVKIQNLGSYNSRNKATDGINSVTGQLKGKK